MRNPSSKPIDVRPGRQPRSYVLSLVALGAIFLMAGSAYFAHGDTDSSEAQSAPEPDQTSKVGPGFMVYSLGELSRIDGPNTTRISFTESSLPFDLSSLVFGDYSPEPKVGDIYYAGSGMILNVSGSDGNVTLKEQGGAVIRTVQHQGQESIVFNGETVYTSSPQATTRYEGTDLLVQDWLDGTWSPEMGVVLERPTGMTIEKAEFFLMVFQPLANVPEFGEFSAVIVIAACACLSMSRLRKTVSQ